MSKLSSESTRIQRTITRSFAFLRAFSQSCTHWRVAEYYFRKILLGFDKKQIGFERVIFRSNVVFINVYEMIPICMGARSHGQGWRSKVGKWASFKNYYTDCVITVNKTQFDLEA